MRFALITLLVAAATSLTSALPSATPNLKENDVAVSSVHNLTERTYTTSTWTYDKCDQIKGSYGFGLWKVNYDLGCVCYDDVDDFCDQNGLGSFVESWMKSILSNSQSYRYPTGAQPTCDDRGGYTCPQGVKQSDGTCSSKTVSCGDNRCMQSDGSCCPRGTVKVNGQCCALTCSGAISGKCTGAATCASGSSLSNGLCCPSGYTGYTKACCPAGQIEDTANPGTCKCSSDAQQLNSKGVCENKCTTGYTWRTTKCCKSYLTETSGVCGCATAGYVDNGSACVAKCTTQQTYNTKTGACDAKCGSGYTWSSSSSNTAGLCCISGHTCQTTICCPSGQAETNGHCCAVGSTWTNNACRAPSGKARRSNIARINTSAQKPVDKAYLSLNDKLCPTNLSACPISGAKAGSYECLDSFTDINSCGGCTSLGRGQDCTAISGAKWMGCEQGSCVVYSCRVGFKLVGGNKCEKI